MKNEEEGKEEEEGERGEEENINTTLGLHYFQ